MSGEDAFDRALQEAVRGLSPYWKKIFEEVRLVVEGRRAAAQGRTVWAAWDPGPRTVILYRDAIRTHPDVERDGLVRILWSLLRHELAHAVGLREDTVAALHF